MELVILRCRYTSDSGIVFSDDAYLSLMHPENDFRQPLFALFATPFCGISILFSSFLSNGLMFKAICENVVQIGMLVFANYLLAKMLKVKPIIRVLFVTLICVAYSNFYLL